MFEEEESCYRLRKLPFNACVPDYFQTSPSRADLNDGGTKEISMLTAGGRKRLESGAGSVIAVQWGKAPL